MGQGRSLWTGEGKHAASPKCCLIKNTEVSNGPFCGTHLSNCMWSHCQSHRVFSNCIVFHWQQGKMLAENKSWEPAAGDWVWFIWTVHMDTCAYTLAYPHTHCCTVHKVFKFLTLTYALYIQTDVDTISVCILVWRHSVTVRHKIQKYEYESTHNTSSHVHN